MKNGRMQRVKKKGLRRGVSSAVLLSAAIHGVLLAIAGGFVVFTVVKREEKKFIPPPPVERPKMELKKPRVRVKKTARPRSTQRIVSRNIQSMPDFQLPEMSGMSPGLSGGIGGFEMMPDPADMTLFGGKKSMAIGNDFEGTFYSMQYDRRGRKNGMTSVMFLKVLKRFLASGWSPHVFAPYSRAPEKLYATQFMIPPISSEFGPAQFGMGWGGDFDPIHWVVHYKGKIAHRTGGRFRFRGMGDDVLVVRVGGELVMNAAWRDQRTDISSWEPSSKEDRKYFFGHAVAAVGDWFELEPETPVEMEVLLGETPGGMFASMLLVEQDGVDYELNRDGAPILPIFKTAEMPEHIRKQIEYTLIDGEADLGEGALFNVY